MLTVATNGRIYTGTAEDIAVALVGADAHPDLIADTVREVEYHGAEVEEAARFEVVKDIEEGECAHPRCKTLHRRFHTRIDLDAYGPWGRRYYGDDATGVDELGIPSELVKWEHVTKVVRWMLVDADGWAVGSFDTRREALAALRLANA